MPVKKNLKESSIPPGIAAQGETTLVEVARTIGSTLGTAAAKAEGAAKDVETFTHAVRKSTVATTRKLYKRAKKGLRAGTASWKAGTKKRKSAKKRSMKSTGRAK